ncbi:type I polyketide synthase [uncultured Cocleimonas sp.]|uniref:type I polyketide synthase n=1 Tax=uncultured Cocleimonas sp. TaxID=1051587 RepID=UPI0026211FB3|nr:type I polyketide synthase [uncultured Cocleimonas sp.]
MSEVKKKIAVVGMACRFPGEASSPDAYWDVLKNGKDVVTEVSSERWGTDFYKHPNKKEPGKSYTFAAGVLPQVDEFDAAFFGISPREAAQMDPQQRLLLELTWEALEDGKQIPQSLAGTQCAVYIGIASTDYAHRRMDDLSSLDPYSMTGNTASIASNRISYIYDLHGPSVSVDTACSSSLVALHQACNAIWNGDAPSAITGGVNMLLHPFGFVGFSKASMLSPRGRCRAFDATGDGYVRSEGSAVLFLKPLEDAEADGDPIHAVIVDTAINSDGRTNGITLPSTEGQAGLLETIYSRAGIHPNDLSYLEAHGTGTAVGDPLEAGALAKVLGRPRKKSLPIGSAKTNLGHLETASGMAGLLKVILSLKNRAIPPSLHFEIPNPNIDFEADKLSVVTSFTPLRERKKPLLMGVNSFGFGGANAHIIVEEYKKEKIKTSQNTKKVKNKTLANKQEQHAAHSPLLLSSKSENALKAMAGQYRDLLQSASEDFDDISYSAYKTRQKFDHGLAINADTVEEVVECLHAYSQGEIHTGATAGTKVEIQNKNSLNQDGGVKLALVFSGNGSQWQGMGCELLEKEPLFLETVLKINELINVYDDISLIDEFKASEGNSRLHLTEVAQPLLFALQVGVIIVLESKGLKADAVIGHSVGEVAAAWAAGALDLAQATEVIYRRSHAQGKTSGMGRMAAVAISESDANELISELLLESDVSIAGINSPKSVTLSGSLESLQLIESNLKQNNVFCRILDLDYAFHSSAMDPVKNEIQTSLKELKPQKTKIEFFSTVSGDLFKGEELDANYWWENIRKPVLFSSAMGNMLDEGYQVYLEIGPHPVLRTYVNECSRAKDVSSLALTTIKRQSETKTGLLSALYSCYLAGCNLDEIVIFPKKVSQYVDLPHYPWQKERHWYSLTAEGSDLVNRDRVHPLLGYRLKNHEACWENQVDVEILSYLNDHVVDGGAVMPAAAFVEMALAASNEWFSTDDGLKKQWEIENLEIRAPIVLDHGKSLLFKLFPKDGSFIISSRDRLSESQWSENVVGRLLGKTNKKVPENYALNSFVTNSNHTISSKGHYKLTESVGLSYGPTFQGIEEVWVSSLSALAKIKSESQLNIDNSLYLLHPALLDAGFQVLVDIFSNKIENGNQAALIPVQIGKLYYYSSSIENLSYLHVNVTKQSPQSVVADYLLLDSDGAVLVELKDCRFRGVQLMRSAALLPACYEFQPFLMPLNDSASVSPVAEPAVLVSNAVEFLKDHESTLQRDRHYQEVLPLFDLMVSMFAWQAIQTLNPKGDEFTLQSLAEQAHIESVKLPLLSRLLEILVEDDLATFENEQWLLVASSDLPSAEDIWLSVLGDSPVYLPELMLLGRCGKHLADVLQNKIDAKSLLFSNKSSIQEHWSGASPSNLSMNLALRDILSEIVSDWPANKRLRVLEIGGNYTEISQQILPVLPEEQCDYLYVHHDEELLLKADFSLEDWDFVNTQQIDLSQDISNSLLNDAKFDIVIAANTLYRSDDCAKAQENIKKVLSPKGVMLLIERQSDRFMDMTFGLQADWWIHTSDVTRPSPLLMTANSWRSDLKDLGFDQVELLVEPEATGDVGAFMVIANHNHTVAIEKTATKENEIQNWMILKDDDEISSSLSHAVITELNKAGHQVILVETGETYKRLGPMHFSLNFDSSNNEKEEHFDHILSTLKKQEVSCDVIVHLMGLRWYNETESSEVEDIELGLQNLRCSSTIDLVKGLEKSGVTKMPQLKIVTSGGATLAEDNQDFLFDTNPSQAPLWGLGRVIMNEHPDLDCKLIDLQGKFDLDITSRVLMNELLLVSTDNNENEVIVNENVRHVMRMKRTVLRPKAVTKKIKNAKNIKTTTAKTKKDIDYCLKFSSPGQLKNLIWQELSENFCRADEIQIKPHAAGLNFRDVMYAMGLLSDEAVENGFAGPTLGMEVSGVVTKIGSAVTEFNMGDEVVGFAPACFSSRVITQTTAITHKPKDWSFEEATTIPTTFFTVYYALKHLAQIEPGEKILIHGAAGGVGIAAIQYARYCGAEIFATAGSDEKRDFVRLLGADHVMDSRSLAFADEIMEITNGSGIDIVLNSLAGEAITRNLSILKPFGRFLELGKRDFYENSKVGLRPFRNNISYFGIDADQLLIERPKLANRLFKEMMKLFDDGSLRPMPYRAFPATRIEDAFRYMQQSRQIGKVVVSFENSNSISQDDIHPLPMKDEELVCDSKASYLVTGGLSGFGLKTACWLVDKGARSLVLVSRSANVSKTDEETKAILDSLKAKGVSIYTRACDVTNMKSVTKLVCEIQQDIPPLKGVVHAAMVLDDGLIRNMSQEQFLTVMQPKVMGGWNLHKATTDIDLDFFVLYSSATTYVGNPGQANYVAANSYLESLAAYRKSLGLAANYVAWGAISDVGYLARNEETKEALQSRLGGEALNSDKALKMLEKIILSDKVGVGVIDLDWGVIQRVMPAANSPKYDELKRMVKTSESDHFEDIQTLIANLGQAEIQELVVDLLLDEIEQILRLPREKLDVERSIFDLGMDSLMGMELVLAIEERFGVKLPVMALTEGANILRIAERITEQLSESDDDSMGADSDLANNKSTHEESISVAASRHGHAENMTEKEAEELSKKLIEDAMKH